VRVALVCERCDPRGGGLEQWVAAFAAGLQRRGHDVHVVTFRADGAPPPGVAVHGLPWSNRRRERARRADAAVVDLAADVVHDTGVGCRCDVLHPQGGSRLVNARRDAASCTWTERLVRGMRPSFWRWRAEWRALEDRHYARHTGLVVAGARQVMRDLHDLHAVPMDRLRLVPNGVDTQRFSPAACAASRRTVRRDLGVDSATVFLFAAHNPRLKGLRPLLRSLRSVSARHPGVTLLVIGRAPDPSTQRLVRRLGVGSATRFLGHVPDPLPYYAAADAFVLPTYYDACSLTVLEAAACGLPAITTRDNGVSELLTDGHDGFVLRSADDTGALAGAMLALTDSAVRHRTGVAARALAERHTLEDCVHAIERIYDDVMHQRRMGRTA
jgi:UDP-glucose:(heptosyl)LPS alpha-1,3-glucosyltransferase